jgi:hypothetical protein
MKESFARLIGYLQKLQPDGPEGLEGLIARLLERLTGSRFFLAKAGSQEGRDMSTGGFGGTWIAVESKRFRSSTSFKRRELLGELVEAARSSALDLWVLASTARVPDQIVSALREEGAARGIAVETLDAPSDRLGDLPVLCAAYGDEATPFLGAIVSENDLRRVLEEIRTHSAFTPLLENIRERFNAGSIGYAQALASSHAYLLSAFGEARRARVELGQPINVLEDGGRHVVERRQALSALDSWWSGWPSASKPFALLGEEGMGKTWAIASWLARGLQTQNRALPLTLFLPSSGISSSDALDLIAGALASCTEVRDSHFWSRRARAFAERSPAKRPALFLILDGLNERPQFNWRALLESLQISPWKDQVAVVLTCRPAYWHEYLAYSLQRSIQLFELEAYDDVELTSALEKAGLNTTELSKTLDPLLRHPRYLDMTVKYREALEQSGDVTVDRLLYEDWKDRTSRKQGLFSEEEFRSFLVRLAEEHRESLLSKRDIQDLLPHGDEFLTGLDEIITGGILVRRSFGQYAVEPRRLIQGFGLLLAEEVRSVTDQGEAVMREAMASFLEPHADMDRKVAVCRFAATFAIVEPGFPEAAQYVLLEHWVGIRNLSWEDVESFTAYLPASIAAYLRLVERSWTTRRGNHQVQSLLVRAFFRWRESMRVQEALVDVCERWLSYVHPFAYRFMRDEDESRRANLRREIEERAGRSLNPGDKFHLVDELEVVEDARFLELADAALLLASLFPRAPFMPALRRWALSRSIMGHPDEHAEVAWMLRWSDEDLWPALEVAVRPLLEGPRVAQQAAWRLLWASGREEATLVLDSLPKDLFPPAYEDKTYAEDPCRYYWRKEDCSKCAARPDIEDRLVALGLAPYAVDPDLRIDFDLHARLLGAISDIRIDELWSGRMMTSNDSDFRRIEPVLAAFAPDLLAESYRILIRDFPNRAEEDRSVLAPELGGLTLLMRKRERRAIRRAWERICSTETWSDETEHAEETVFAALLFHLSAREQLSLLLARPSNAFNALRLGQWFKRLGAKDLKILARGLSDSPPDEIKRKLWFLWYQDVKPVVQGIEVERLMDLLDHADPEIQHIASEWLFLHGTGEILDLAVRRGAVTPSWTQSSRQEWGGVSAGHMRSRLPYERLSNAIDLGSLSYMIRRRSQDLERYTHDLDRAIQAAARAENRTLATGFCFETLRRIVKREPDVVKGWIRLAVADQDPRSPLFRSSHMMFEALCEVLLEVDPAQGELLFKALLEHRRNARTVDNTTGVDVLALALFRVPRSEQSEALLREWLGSCMTDKALFELALAGLTGHRDERLCDAIRQGLSFRSPVKRGAALMLAGFAADGLSGALLESVQLHSEGWLYVVRDLARRHRDRDRWAQEWFHRFATKPDIEESFAAFRLFLRCVDRRYWTWKDSVLGSARMRPSRLWYLKGNRDQIDKAIKENEKDLEKRFLGYEITEGKVHPWASRYIG